MAIDAWERQLGSLSLELGSLLEWTYVISRSGQPFSAVFLRNHSSLDGEAMEALWPTVARMLWKGILEYCERHHPAARRIIACGAVPHSSTSWKRPLNDYRGSNIYIYIYQDPWPVKCISIRTISLSIKCNALFWTKDLASAYYNGKFVGMLLPCPRCHALGAGPPQAEQSYVPLKSRRFGCDPELCVGTCDRTWSGVCLGGHNPTHHALFCCAIRW